jgi:hypothetical protein
LCKIVTISKYIVEYVVVHWWNSYNNIINRNIYLLFIEKNLLEHNLKFLHQTTRFILKLDHTYKFTKCLGAYNKTNNGSTWIK